MQHIKSIFYFVIQEDQLEDIQHDINGFNQNKEPTHFIGEYAVLELLGAGAFGSVHKVKKRNGQSYLAMKEVSTEQLIYIWHRENMFS